MPYIEETYKEITDLLEYPAPTVRKSAVVAVSSVCIAVCKVAEETKAHDAETGTKITGIYVTILCTTYTIH